MFEVHVCIVLYSQSGKKCKNNIEQRASGVVYTLEDETQS